MKYVVIIPDGAGDGPIDGLDERTPLEAAHTPHLDRLAHAGRVGTAATTPPSFDAGSDVCSMSLLGYDPETYHTGRAPLEAASTGIRTDPDDWIFRLNLVTVGEENGPYHTDPGGRMLDHSGGALGEDEARELFAGLTEHWQREDPRLAEQFDLYHGKSYRGTLVDRSGSRGTRRRYDQLTLTEPHGIPGERWDAFLPEPRTKDAEEAADVIARLTELSAEFLASADANRARVRDGRPPANLAWIWGQGTPVALPTFNDRFGVRGAMIASVDLLTGLARAMSLDVIDVPGMTSYHDTDYAAQGRATVEALEHYDLVVSHVEAPDEMSHQGDWQTKVASIESIDREIIGPVAEALSAYGDPEDDSSAEGWRMLVLPDHYTLCSTRCHDPTPVPFMICGAWVRSVVSRPMTERAAESSDLHVDPGHELMEYFLRGGLARVRGAIHR